MQTADSPQPIGTVQVFIYDCSGLQALQTWLLGNSVPALQLHAVMEATGVYWERCAHFLHDLGCMVSVVNPAQIKFFAQSLLRRGKTDRMDADIIARYGAIMRPKAWKPPAAELEALKLLVHEREAIVKELTQAKNRRHSFKQRQEADPLVVQLTEARITFLTGQVEALNRELRARVEALPDLQRQVELLQSLPGFGFLVSLTVLVETAGFNAMETSRQLAAYAGVSPAPNQSGAMIKCGRISNIGNPRLRRIVYLASVAATRTQSKEKAFDQRLREQGRPGKVAIIALARKLLCVGFAVVQSGCPYDPT
ncbi:IS110 family transposase [Deinococcus koreensis]|uniref:IS110 family transposase n=1 Tax=Deinococcus koreensis TaxID=2054903 RepID=A0A2K3US59_9DEIO|nr:IS110 family transposase [Deinococcus koreensis]PNY79373.1 IS110 family transposase [Deinococcus koreensis]